MSENTDEQVIAEAEHERTAELNNLSGYNAKDELTAAYGLLNDCPGLEREELFETIGKAMAHIQQAKIGLGY